MGPSVIRENKITLKNSCETGNARQVLEKSIRQLEKQFETNVETGLITTEAERRLSKKESQLNTKLKKRLWHLSAKQECHDPLFFFQIYLCIFFLFAGEKCGMISWIALFVMIILKSKQIVVNYRWLRKQINKKVQNALVLRDGIYREMDIRNIVTGDILRIKKGQKVPVSVWSVQNPGNKYWEGEIFQEESGKVIACGTTNLKKCNGKYMEYSEDFKEKNRAIYNSIENMEAMEGNILYVLCGFSFLFLVYGWISGQPESFQWMFQMAALVSGGLAVVKEIIGIRDSSLN